MSLRKTKYTLGFIIKDAGVRPNSQNALMQVDGSSSREKLQKICVFLAEVNHNVTQKDQISPGNHQPFERLCDGLQEKKTKKNIRLFSKG